MRSLDAVMAVRAMPDETTLRYAADAELAVERRTTLALHYIAIGKFMQGQHALATNNMIDAIASFKQGYEAVPTLRENYMMLLEVGRHLIREGDARGAEPVLRWLAAKEPNNGEVTRLLAEANAGAR